MRQAGYGGIEIAPFTLGEDPATIAPGQRREYRDVMASENMTFVGLHWLLASPAGLHVTTLDAKVRCRSWRHIESLIDLCADLGPGGVMVFGSPKQRSTTGGLSRADATERLVEGLSSVASKAGERDVTILLEALPRGQSDVVTSLDEAAAIVSRIGHPSIRTMFDSHNAVDEHESHAALVARHFDVIRHVHVNETDGRHPGTGRYDFNSIFEVLRRRGYQGWISLEVFDFAAGAETIARESLRYLETEIDRLS